MQPSRPPRPMPPIKRMDFTPDIDDDADDELQPPPDWPTLAPEALSGIAGEFTRAATFESEADPAAVLATFLVNAGAHFGSKVAVRVGDRLHPPRLFAAIVGASGRGRKGTSTAPVEALNSILATDLQPSLRISPGPMSSGEGLIFAVRDAGDQKDKEGQLIDAGVADKRLLVVDSEMGSLLRVAKREGNTVTNILRCAWDSGTIEPLTKRDRIKATNAHVCIVGHITQNELSTFLQSTDVFNGFANRFLWIAARRQKIVAVPPPIDQKLLLRVSEELRMAVEQARALSEIEFSAEAHSAWVAYYKVLTQDQSGTFGALVSRAEAQTIRLALLYALLEGSTRIDVDHLKSAIGFWDYCHNSTSFIFRVAANDPTESKILEILGSGPKSTSELFKAFHNKISATELSSKLMDLQGLGKITQRSTGGGSNKGRPKTLWSLM